MMEALFIAMGAIAAGLVVGLLATAFGADTRDGFAR